MISSSENFLHNLYFCASTHFMKQIVFIFSLLLLYAVSAAQVTKGKPVITKSAPAKPVNILKTLEDSVSYSIGTSVANFYKAQGVKKLNTALISKAITDIMSGKKALVDDAAANTIMNTYMTRLQEQKSKATIDAGQKFLAANKVRPGVKTTASGLQYEVITEGTGIKPTALDTFVCNYRGTFIDGTEFDASANRGVPLTYGVSQVIAGWTEALQMMAVGSKYKLFVPYNLGYGAFDYNSIPGGSALIFEIELLDVKKKQ